MPVYIAARDLDGFAIGTHQFIIIEDKSNPHPAAKLDDKVISPKNLGKGKIGYVIGAHNQSNLVVQYFEKSDLKGFDIANKKRIPRTYFTPNCPIKRRPTVN